MKKPQQFTTPVPQNCGKQQHLSRIPKAFGSREITTPVPLIAGNHNKKQQTPAVRSLRRMKQTHKYKSQQTASHFKKPPCSY